MSVQVKHRRDTAANIATFTPAQGELIVDTTNNRVLVGDGVTLGGWSAAKLSEALTSSQVGAANGVASLDATGHLTTAQSPAHTGDATSVAGSTALTLATVNTSPGTFGGASAIPVLTVNGKGLLTAASTVALAAANVSGLSASATTDATNASNIATGTLAMARLPAAAQAGRTAVSDAAYSVTATDRLVAYTALTAARVVTLPSAASYPTGAVLRIVDESGACSVAKPITIARAGTDTINGGVSLALLSAYGNVSLESNGSNAWTSVGGGSSATLLAASGVNGSTMTFNVLEQIVSGLSGASVTAATSIPAGALVLSCAMRVTTAIAGATSFAVGYTGSTSAFGSSLGIAVGTTNQGLIGPNPVYSATSLVLTPTGGNFTAGAVRLSLMYLTFTPPTS